MSKHQPYLQLWREFRTQSRLGVAAGLALTVSLVCLPWALTKARSADKLMVLCVGALATEAARRSTWGYFDYRDTDADLTYAEKRELIQQHVQYLREEPEVIAPVQETQEDDTIADVVSYWLQQDKHLLVIGGSGAGKTTFTRNFSKHLRNWRTVVYDIDATVSDWKWTNAVYHEFDDISEQMTSDLSLIPEIRAQRHKLGDKWQAQPTLMIADEFPALVSELAVAKKWLATHAKQTRKHKRMICVLAQNDTVGNLGLKGDISVRDTCFTLVYLGDKAAERAKAIGKLEWINVLRHSKEYAIVDDKLARRPT